MNNENHNIKMLNFLRMRVQPFMIFLFSFTNIVYMSYKVYEKVTYLTKTIDNVFIYISLVRSL